MLGVDLEQSLRMVSLYPAQFLRLDHEIGRIAPGYRANLALLDAQLNVAATWIDGRGIESG
jgi:N-acetylglucosamine-6-phosphate deacetylase